MFIYIELWLLFFFFLGQEGEYFWYNPTLFFLHEWQSTLYLYHFLFCGHHICWLSYPPFWGQRLKTALWDILKVIRSRAWSSAHPLITQGSAETRPFSLRFISYLLEKPGWQSSPLQARSQPKRSMHCRWYSKLKDWNWTGFLAVKKSDE